MTAPTLVVGAAVVLAACGSSSTKASSPSTTKATPTSAAVVVKTVKNPTLGTILVDSSGRTLYTLTNNGTAVACTGECLTAWPPLLLPSGTSTATGSAGVTGLAVVSGTGGQQVTEKGLPLYRFSADTTAGDAKGDGISSFGGTWHVVKVSGTSSSGGSGGSSGAATSTTQKSSSGGGGY